MAFLFLFLFFHTDHRVLLCIVASTFTKIYHTLRISKPIFHCQAHIPLNIPIFHIPQVHILLNIARYRKTVSSALWVQITFFVCYLPYLLVIIVFITGMYTRMPAFYFGKLKSQSMYLLLEDQRRETIS